MRKLIYVGLIGVLFCLCGCSGRESMQALTQRVFALAEKQYAAMDADSALTDRKTPRSTNPDGSLRTAPVRWWCSGFYPGALWYVYEYTGNDRMRHLAEKHTLKLDTMQYVTTDHDVGFQLNCSYGNALRLTGDKTYAEVMRRGAHSLATRFNPTTGVIRSWDFVRKGRDWKYPVIIDNMMNLELLMRVAELYADDSLRMVACSHANTTLRNHFRDDYTSFHLVDYDPETGAVRSRQTVQGFADASAWARGQAWAVYGYTMMFRMTKYQNYLTQAERIADMLVVRLPEDGIPYWDFDSDKIPNDLRDASAGAIMASALVELSQYVADSGKAESYLQTAERQLRTLASPDYLAPEGENGHFLLRHSVGSMPDGKEIDVPLSYADYYFLEALLRYQKVKQPTLR